MKTYWRALGLSRLFIVSAALVPLFAGAQVMKPASVSVSPSTSVSEVAVDHAGQRTLVRVAGSGKLSYHVTRQSDPPRVIVDFDNASLSLLRHAIPSEFEPVAGIRIDQFTTSAVRMVIDLTRPATLLVDNSGASLVISFADSAVAANQSPVPP